MAAFYLLGYIYFKKTKQNKALGCLEAQLALWKYSSLKKKNEQVQSFVEEENKHKTAASTLWMSVWTLNRLCNKCIFILWSSLEANKKLICWSAVTARHILSDCIRMPDGNVWVDSANLQKFNTFAFAFFQCQQGDKVMSVSRSHDVKALISCICPRGRSAKWASTVFHGYSTYVWRIGLWDQQICENEIQQIQIQQNTTVSKDHSISDFVFWG